MNYKTILKVLALTHNTTLPHIQNAVADFVQSNQNDFEAFLASRELPAPKPRGRKPSASAEA